MAVVLLSAAPTVDFVASRDEGGRMGLMRPGAWAAVGVLSATLLAGAAELAVTQAGPVGEIAKLEEANEIRVVFSEPMVALGRIPETAAAPFFRIKPEIPGRFRWSG